MMEEAVGNATDLPETACTATGEGSPGLDPDSPPLLATDSAAMMSRYVEVPDDVNIKETCDFVWEIPDWTELPSRIASSEFHCGGGRWKLLLYPEGNPISRSRGHIALYLKALPPNVDTGDKSGDASESGDSEGSTRSTRSTSHKSASPPSKWAVCATFALSIWNPKYPEVFVAQSARNRFHSAVCDWGYGEFTPLREAFIKAPHSSAPLIDGPVNISCHMQVLDDPTGVLWHDFVDYNSREETGYTGLMNQGATCYLNSLLQSLYFTKIFRQAVYDIPESEGVVGGMQRLFYLLSKNQDPVSTLPLTKSFGWDSADAFTQHDVQELNRVLMDHLETKMKGTQVEGELSNIFVGQMKSFIKCINVDFESSRTEDFWDIQLNVKGMRNVADSFRNYVATEVLEGENQYQATGFGLQDAKKGVIFKNFPPVLHLQLKRYDYDWMRDIEVKINDRYEFPLDLDLADFIEPGTPEADENWEYALHGVLVHSGDLNAGHYYALIKPDANGSWYKFDDDRVTKATLREVMEENFGGDQGSNLRRVTSAYMLVYIRKIKLAQVLPESTDTPPESVAEQVALETKAEEERKRKLIEQQQYINLRLLSPKTFRNHTGTGTVPWASPESDELEQPVIYKARREAKIASIRREVGTDASMWLVPLARYHRGGVKMQLLREQHEQQPIEQLSQWTDSASPSLFIEEKPGNPELENLIFVKLFDPHTKELRGIGTQWVPHAATLKEALEGEPVVGVWLESAGPPFSSLTPLDVNKTVSQLGLENADVVIVQSQEAPEDAEFATALEYYDFLLHSMAVWLRPKDSMPGSASRSSKGTIHDSQNDSDRRSSTSSKSIQITANSHRDYTDLITRVGNALQSDPDKIQLWATEYAWRPLTPLRSDGSNLSELWNTGGYDPAICILYRILDRPLTEFEKLRELDVTLVTDQVPQSTVKVLVDQDATIGTVLKEVDRLQAEDTERAEENMEVVSDENPVNPVALEDPEGPEGPESPKPAERRVWTTVYSSISMRKQAFELSSLDRLSEINDDLDDGIYVSAIPEVELKAEATSGSKLVEVFHFEKESWRAYGLPFLMALVPDETVESLRARLQKLLGIPDKAIEKIRLAVCNASSRHRYLESENTNIFQQFKEGDALGLDHIDLSRHSSHQASIVIK